MLPCLTKPPLVPPRAAGFLPRARQTLLFSATMPQAVQQVAGLALKGKHSFIDTIKEEDSATNVQARAQATREGAECRGQTCSSYVHLFHQC